MNEQWNRFIRILKTEVVPATGCTEPVAVALAAATARNHLSGPAQFVEAWVSPNLMKNGMGVMVPGTGLKGLEVAAALGAICGDATAGLNVLGTITENDMTRCRFWLKEGWSGVKVEPGCIDALYARVRVHDPERAVTVTIKDSHTNIVHIEDNRGKVLHHKPAGKTKCDSLSSFFRYVTLRQILEFAEKAPLEELIFINQAAELNDALSREGLKGQWGLQTGRTLNRQTRPEFIDASLMTEIMIKTAAASDARMGGAPLPAMSNSGSGNQGIAATVPVVVVAEEVGAIPEELTRALILSHLTAIYIHSKLPRLSAFCAAATASMGAAAGMAYLAGGRYKTIARTLNLMTGDVTGMVCDGASEGCSLKVSSGALSAWKSVMLALDGNAPTFSEGLAADDVDDSLSNIGEIVCKGMMQTDRSVLNIMINKSRNNKTE